MEISDQQNAFLGSKARVDILNEHNEPSLQTKLCSEELFPSELPTAYVGAVNITSFMEGSSPLLEPFNFFTHPLAGGSTAPLRSTSPPLPPKPRTARTFLTNEKVRKEGAKRQKQFRERQRQGQEEVQRQLDNLATQIKAACVEQESLLTSNKVLTKAAEYCSIAFQAAQSVVSGTIDKLQTEYSPSITNWVESLVEGLVHLGLQVHSPSDSQLHAFLGKKTLSELDKMSENVRKRTLEMHTRWLNEPDARANIEKELERVRELRLRALTYFSTTRTDVASEIFCRRLMPTGPNGEPHPKLVAAVEELEFTPEQLESFKKNWRIYLETTESMRQELRSTVNNLSSSSSSSSSDFKENGYSSTGAAGVLLHRLQDVEELTIYQSKEAHAIGQLCIWFQREITFQQESCLIRHCAPFYPDAIQLGRIIFGDKDPGQTWQAHMDALKKRDRKPKKYTKFGHTVVRPSTAKGEYHFEVKKAGHYKGWIQFNNISQIDELLAATSVASEGSGGNRGGLDLVFTYANPVPVLPQMNQVDYHPVTLLTLLPAMSFTESMTKEGKYSSRDDFSEKFLMQEMSVDEERKRWSHVERGMEIGGRSGRNTAMPGEGSGRGSGGSRFTSWFV